MDARLGGGRPMVALRQQTGVPVRSLSRRCSAEKSAEKKSRSRGGRGGVSMQRRSLPVVDLSRSGRRGRRRAGQGLARGPGMTWGALVTVESGKPRAERRRETAIERSNQRPWMAFTYATAHNSLSAFADVAI